METLHGSKYTNSSELINNLLSNLDQLSEKSKKEKIEKSKPSLPLPPLPSQNQTQFQDANENNNESTTKQKTQEQLDKENILKQMEDLKNQVKAITSLYIPNSSSYSSVNKNENGNRRFPSTLTANNKTPSAKSSLKNRIHHQLPPPIITRLNYNYNNSNLLPNHPRIVNKSLINSGVSSSTINVNTKEEMKHHNSASSENEENIDDLLSELLHINMKQRTNKTPFIYPSNKNGLRTSGITGIRSRTGSFVDPRRFSDPYKYTILSTLTEIEDDEDENENATKSSALPKTIPLISSSSAKRMENKWPKTAYPCYGKGCHNHHVFTFKSISQKMGREMPAISPSPNSSNPSSSSSPMSSPLYTKIGMIGGSSSEEVINMNNNNNNILSSPSTKTLENKINNLDMKNILSSNNFRTNLIRIQQNENRNRINDSNSIDINNNNKNMTSNTNTILDIEQQNANNLKNYLKITKRGRSYSQPVKQSIKENLRISPLSSSSMNYSMPQQKPSLSNYQYNYCGNENNKMISSVGTDQKPFIEKNGRVEQKINFLYQHQEKMYNNENGYQTRSTPTSPFAQNSSINSPSPISSVSCPTSPVHENTYTFTSVIAKTSSKENRHHRHHHHHSHHHSQDGEDKSKNQNFNYFKPRRTSSKSSTLENNNSVSVQSNASQDEQSSTLSLPARPSFKNSSYHKRNDSVSSSCSSRSYKSTSSLNENGDRIHHHSRHHSRDRSKLSCNQTNGRNEMEKLSSNRRYHPNRKERKESLPNNLKTKISIHSDDTTLIDEHHLEDDTDDELTYCNTTPLMVNSKLNGSGMKGHHHSDSTTTNLTHKSSIETVSIDETEIPEDKGSEIMTNEIIKINQMVSENEKNLNDFSLEELMEHIKNF